MILSQAEEGVRSIIKIDLRDGALNKGPDSPVETRDSPELINLFEQSFDFGLGGLDTVLGVFVEASEVFTEEISADSTGGKLFVGALKSTPLGEVVGNVESALNGGSVPIDSWLVECSPPS